MALENARTRCNLGGAAEPCLASRRTFVRGVSPLFLLGTPHRGLMLPTALFSIQVLQSEFVFT